MCQIFYMYTFCILCIYSIYIYIYIYMSSIFCIWYIYVIIHYIFMHYLGYA